jgi:uncharacterized membrane protein
MDEIWSIDIAGGFRLKKSFGTALKFFGNSALANTMVWAMFGGLLYFSMGDHEVVDRIRDRTQLERTYLAQPEPRPWR